MTNESISNEPFFKAQDALREVIFARTGKNPAFKSLRFACESTQLEYLQALADRAGVRSPYETELRSLLNFDSAELFHGTIAEHAEAILKTCATAVQPRKKASGVEETGVPWKEDALYAA